MEKRVKSPQFRPAARRPAGRLAAAGPLDEVQTRAVAALFATLAEASRLRILQALEAGPKSVGELVERTGLKQANVSKQLGILQSAGIIARRQDGNRAFYSIEMPLVFDLCELVCQSAAQQAAARAQALQR